MDSASGRRAGVRDFLIGNTLVGLGVPPGDRRGRVDTPLGSVLTSAGVSVVGGVGIGDCW